jgi:hypothetical protein
VGDPQAGEQYQRSSLTVVKVLSPMSGFPRKSGIPRKSFRECQQDLIAGLPQDWRNRDFTLGGQK